MKALISPNEIIYTANGSILGSRIAQTSSNAFEVAPPLFWVDCSDDCISYSYYYLDGQLYPIPSE
jgi:hypothetical protein